MGNAAAEMLFGLIHSEKTEASILLPAKFVVRESFLARENLEQV